MAQNDDYEMLGAMLNGGPQQVRPGGKFIPEEQRTAQVNPYEGDYYTYGQKGGEHMFVDYGGLFQPRPALPSQNAPNSGQVFTGATPQGAVSGLNEQESAQVQQLITALNKPAAGTGVNYLDLLVRDPSRSVGMSPGMNPALYQLGPGWNQGGN